MELIRKHNYEEAIGLHTYTLGVNQFADLTNVEWRNELGCIVRKDSPVSFQEIDDEMILPDFVDWRDSVSYRRFVSF